jgi:acylpyruvate hydrolase
MKLLSFEVVTHLGRHRRLGAWKTGRVIDLNFATAWYLAQTGEPEAQQLADALVPPRILDFLRAGLRATHTAEELFLGAGPQPVDWWKHDPPPRGPNDETLVYQPGEVRLLAPIPHYAAPGEDIAAPGDRFTIEARLAAVIGIRRTDIPGFQGGPLDHIAGFTIMAVIGNRTALGPYIRTLDKLTDPYSVELSVRVNGEERARSRLASQRGGFEAAIESRAGGAPGDVIGLPAAGIECRRGDRIEIEVDSIGVLSSRIV